MAEYGTPKRSRSPDPAASTPPPARRPWVPPRLEPLGALAELTSLQVTAECSIQEPNCDFGGFSTPSSAPPGAIELLGGGNP